jgi:hypothetical protein
VSLAERVVIEAGAVSAVVTLLAVAAVVGLTVVYRPAAPPPDPVLVHNRMLGDELWEREITLVRISSLGRERDR